MEELFMNADAFGKTLYMLAAFSTPILIIQLILTFIGLDSTDAIVEGDVDMDMDADGDGGDGSTTFQMWTFRNFIAFFASFSWTGIVCMDNGVSNGWSAAIATAVGLFMVFVVSAIFYAASKLQHDGTPNQKAIVGKTASVYMPIEKGKSGKITVSLGGAPREFNAKARDNDKEFESHQQVKVVSLEGDCAIVDSI